MDFEKKKLAEKEREKELQDVRKILSIPEGRRLLWRILAHASIYNRSFTIDSGQTAFNEGRRSLGLWLIDEITDADVEKFFQMHREAHSNQKIKLRKESDDN